MKGNTWAIVVLLLISTTACTPSLTPAFISATEKDNKILCVLERTPCYGKCPAYTITIYKNGLVKKYNRRFTEDDGATYYGIVDKNPFKQLETKALDAGFLKMDSIYPPGGGVADLPGTRTVFNLKSIHKQVMNMGIGAPEALTSLETQIDETAKKYAVTKQKM